MDIQIIVTLRTTAPDINKVADAIYSAIDRVVDNANFAAGKNKHNCVLAFQAVEIRPNSTVTRFFKFPDDLDKVKPVNNG